MGTCIQQIKSHYTLEAQLVIVIDADLMGLDRIRLMHQD